eukprot:TRINITY_DN21074_c0_g1_i1.p1 TRINITY_DN21074_c0_g1~~TRINITY_DN21074_c0_g1_i1.p1  ORF type:complete len:279 (+),score=32.91 TRINITY_DN21074_c0_g1_i1:23-859(+)
MGNSTVPAVCSGECETGCLVDETSELIAVLEVDIFPDVLVSPGQAPTSHVSVWGSASDPAKSHVYGQLNSALSEDNAAVVLALCTADLDMADMERALFAASRLGSLNVARELVAIGVGVDSADPVSGLTALHYAAYSGHCEICIILLDAQADANCEAKGFTPISIAREFGRTEAVEVLRTHSSTITQEVLEAHVPTIMLEHSSGSDLLPRVSEGLAQTLATNTLTDISDCTNRDGELRNVFCSKDDESEVSRMCMRDFLQLQRKESTSRHNEYALNPL